MRKTLWSACALLLIACQTGAVRSDGTRPVAATMAAGAAGSDLYPREDPDEVKLRDELATTRMDVVAEGEGLGKLLDRLAEAQHVNIDANWAALQTVGVDKASPVTVKVRSVSLGRALDEVLTHVGGATAALAYAVDGGILRVSTPDELNSDRHRVTRVYPIGDILLMRSLPDESESANNGGLFGGNGMARRINDSDIRKEYRTLIEATVAPYSWVDNGGTVGRFTELDRKFIIDQTPENHHAIVEALKSFRAEINRQIAIDSRLVAVDAKTLRALKLDSLPHVLTPSQAEAVVKTLASSPRVHTLAVPRFTILNGQTALLRAGHFAAPLCASSIVSGTADALPSVQPAAQSATTSTTQPSTQPAGPRIEDRSAGFALQVTAAESANGSVAVHVAPALSFVSPPIANGPADTTYQTDLNLVTFSSTLIIPSGHTALVGGLPLSLPDGSKHLLYVFVLLRPTIIRPAR